MPLEEFIIHVYCLVVAYLKKLLGSKKLRKRGPQPQLTDGEVITMEIVGEFLGYPEDKALWEYFKTHWLHYFPKLGTRETFIRQAANLWWTKEQIQKHLASDLDAFQDDLHFFDGFPLAVCHFKRAGYSRCFQGEASYGYCAAKEEIYYGFEGHLVISSQGIPTTFTLAAAHIDERDVLPELAQGFQGLLLADKGLIRPTLTEELAKKAIDLQTSLRANMKDKRPKWFVKTIVSLRRLVETVIGQLTERFSIEHIRARTLWHLSRRFLRKILSHTVAFAINKTINPENPLQFERLITA
jgi:hypothetical protein